VMGTLNYVAPEQLRGEAVDGRADVYALGCMLFELLSGQVPFVRDSDAAKVWAHMSDPPPRPSLVYASVPLALDDVCARAMAKQPRERFASAGAMAQAAEDALRSPHVDLAPTELDAGQG
jgi:serine/threonine protein kinase